MSRRVLTRLVRKYENTKRLSCNCDTFCTRQAVADRHVVRSATRRFDDTEAGRSTSGRTTQDCDRREITHIAPIQNSAMQEGSGTIWNATSSRTAEIDGASTFSNRAFEKGTSLNTDKLVDVRVIVAVDNDRAQESIVVSKDRKPLGKTSPVL